MQLSMTCRPGPLSGWRTTSVSTLKPAAGKQKWMQRGWEKRLHKCCGMWMKTLCGSKQKRKWTYRIVLILVLRLSLHSFVHYYIIVVFIPFFFCMCCYFWPNTSLRVRMHFSSLWRITLTHHYFWPNTSLRARMHFSNICTPVRCVFLFGNPQYWQCKRQRTRQRKRDLEDAVNAGKVRKHTCYYCLFCYFMSLINNRGLERTSLRVVGVNILVPNTASFSRMYACLHSDALQTDMQYARTHVCSFTCDINMMNLPCPIPTHLNLYIKRPQLHNSRRLLKQQTLRF